MSEVTTSTLREQIARLEAENAALRTAASTVGETPVAGTADQPKSDRPKSRGWGWTLLATVLIVLGGLLAPVATVASWARVQLSDTDAFVAAYAPLADDPGVQAFVADEATNAIEENVDIPGLTAQIVDGITELGTGPAATSALQALEAPAAEGILSLIRSTVGTFVASDAFAEVWEEALRISHTQLIAALQNDPNAVIAVGSDGSVGIQLGPIVERVQQVLIDRGLTFAEQIPPIDRTITVAQESSLPTLQLFYGVAIAAGTWLPWLALALLGAGVAVARRRPIAIIWAAVALALGMIVVIAGLAIGRLVFIGTVSPSLIPSDVARTVFDTVTAAMVATGVAVLVLAAAWAVVAWLAGPFSVPRKLRHLFHSGVERMRRAAERGGISTGRTGEWFYAQRSLLRAGIAVIAAAVVLLVRPVTVSLTIWTLVLAGLAVVVVELVQRPPIDDTLEQAAPTDEEPPDDEVLEKAVVTTPITTTADTPRDEVTN